MRMRVERPDAVAGLLILCLMVGPLLGGCGREGPPASARPDVRQLVESILSAPDKSTSLAAVTVDYPLADSVFPPDMVAPTFLWHDEAQSADAWLVEFAFGDGKAPRHLILDGPPPPKGLIDPAALGPTNEAYEPTEHQASARSWTPDEALWFEIKRRTAQVPVDITLYGFALDAPDEPLSRGSVRISTSTDPVGAPIFYRDVPLMPSETKKGQIKPLAPDAIPLIAWRLKDVSRKASRLLLTDMPTCANCHSFSRDGKVLGMDVDGPYGDKGTYALAPISERMRIDKRFIITWNSFRDKPKDHKTIGFLSQVSPDGRYAVTTLNESLYVANFLSYEFLQVFYPTRGILAYYDSKARKMRALPGADDPEFVHCDPTWSPDGSYLVFSRATAKDPYPAGVPLATYADDPQETPMQYDLYRLPFAGGRGGTPQIIEGASQNGMSNTFPKISPDGKWIVFVKCRNGQLQRPDSRLWIVPAEGGAAREMTCNTRLMNSWHSFSPNGRWMVFSSKANTPYTQMFLTHIDENGNDTPPILIPNATAANRAVNIPEFLNADYEDLLEIVVPAVDHRRHYQQGLDLMIAGDAAAAEQHFRTALEHEPESSETLVNLGAVLFKMRRPAEARVYFEKAVQIDPRNGLACSNLGFILYGEGKVEKAIEYYRRALEADPAHTRARLNLGLALMDLGRMGEAYGEYVRALEDEPENPAIRHALATILLQEGQREEAAKHLEKLLEIDSRNPWTQAMLAWVLVTSPEDDLRDGPRGVQLAEGACNATGRQMLEALDALGAAYAEVGRFEDAVMAAEEALTLDVRGTESAAIRSRLALYRQGAPFREE